MKLRIIIAISVIFVLYVQIIGTIRSREKLPNFGCRPTAISCESDNQTVLTKYCFLKPYSRYVVTINVGFQILVPLKKPFYSQILVYYRYGTIFRQAIDTKQNEWCSFMDGTAINPLIKLVSTFINETFPQLYHKCPYEGELNFFNL